MARDERLEQLLNDHIIIVQRVKDNDEQGAVDADMVHLSRLDNTIEVIRAENADYFSQTPSADSLTSIRFLAMTPSAATTVVLAIDSATAAVPINNNVFIIIMLQSR